MRTIILGAAATCLLVLPTAASAAEGFATANVNMRSGPSTGYPAVTVIPVGSPVEIHGCLADLPWCDVSFYNGRGWVAARYVQADYRQNRVYLEPEIYRPLGIPTVTFELGTYWDRNYRGRDFYRERDDWRRGPDFYQRERRERRDRQRDEFRVDQNRDRNDNGWPEEYPRRTDEQDFDRPDFNRPDVNADRDRRLRREERRQQLDQDNDRLRNEEIRRQRREERRQQLDQDNERPRNEENRRQRRENNDDANGENRRPRQETDNPLDVFERRGSNNVNNTRERSSPSARERNCRNNQADCQN